MYRRADEARPHWRCSKIADHHGIGHDLCRVADSGAGFSAASRRSSASGGMARSLLVSSSGSLQAACAAVSGSHSSVAASVTQSIRPPPLARSELDDDHRRVGYARRGQDTRQQRCLAASEETPSARQRVRRQRRCRTGYRPLSQYVAVAGNTVSHRVASAGPSKVSAAARQTA